LNRRGFSRGKWVIVAPQEPLALGEVEFFKLINASKRDQKIEARQDVQEIPGERLVFRRDRGIVQRVRLALRSVFRFVAVWQMCFLTRWTDL